MNSVTELRVRGDWQFVRLVYLPIVGAGLTPFHLCALCQFCWWWGHHLEEWISRKTLFQITATGIRYEDGGRPVEYAWEDIRRIVLHRRGTIPFWRTDGEVKTGTPPFWLAITVSEHRRDGNGNEQTICIWPRQVRGGLFSLVRFARELQRQLIDASSRGEIPSLLPSKGRAH